MRTMLKLALSAAAVAATSPALAGTYTFSFTPSQALLGTPYSGSGIFTTSDTALTVNNQTAFAITGITGTINGSAINNVAGPSYGNYFTTGGYFLDGSGVNITTANGMSLNFFNQSSNNIYRVNGINPFSTFFVNATSSAVVASAVPEPASWAMMIGGFGIVGGSLRRKRKVATLSFA
ncbi:MAG TPA: PEPxxWA-CTERM sorting domain-containing protein [Sphingomicrobium sp.]